MLPKVSALNKNKNRFTMIRCPITKFSSGSFLRNNFGKDSPGICFCVTFPQWESSYLLVGHFEEFERGLLQGGGRLLDVLSRFRVLVGQKIPDLRDLLLELGALRGNMTQYSTHKNNTNNSTADTLYHYSPR